MNCYDRVRFRRTFLCVSLLSMLFASVALANALVVVKIRAAGDKVVDGVVTLSARSGDATFSCETKEGACKIDNVPGGAYTVKFAPKAGTAPKPRPVMIPPEGTVSLFISAN
jgi:hypothetical protein